MRQLHSRNTNQRHESKVRIAKKADVSALAAFFMQAWKEAGPGSLGFTGATDEAVQEIASREFLTSRLSSPKVRIIVAESENRILGFASLATAGHDEAELSGIVVLRSTSGKGIGTRLLQKACRVAANLGFRRLSVKTEVFNNRAIRFYKENGFVQTRKTVQKVGKAMVPIQVLEKYLR